MRVYVFMFVFVLFAGHALLAACSKDEAAGESSAANVAKEKTKKQPAGLKVGDVVVARWSGGGFYEGKVDKIDADQVTIAWSDGSKPSETAREEVYTIPPAGAKPKVAVGQFVVARQGKSWVGAEVVKATAEAVAIKYTADGSIENLEPHQVIKISNAAAADLAAEKASKAFLQQARNRQPRKPRGWRPRRGDAVLATWATSWYEGTVAAIKGDVVTVKWSGSSSKPSERSLDKVAPIPAGANKASFALPSKGDYLLVKGGGARWKYARAETVAGGQVSANLPDGDAITVKRGEYLILN